MALNWSSIGSTLSGVATALGAAGLTPGSANFNSIMGSIGLAMNPNQSEELAICQQIIMYSANPMLLTNLVTKLMTEQGLPMAAAQLASTLLTPGTDIPTRVIQIEQIIKQGS